MLQKIILTILILHGLCPFANSQSFLKRLGDKAANAGGDLILNKARNKADKALDTKPGTKKKNETNANQEKAKEESGAAEFPSEKKSDIQGKKMASAKSKFDFVPGEKILLFDNFEQDVIGEFPLKWFTNGSAEVVSLEDQHGKWLQFNSGTFLSPVAKIPENFTIEFDVFINLSTKSSAVLPGFGFQLFDRGDKASRLDVYKYSLNNLLSFSNHFSHDKATVKLDSRENKNVKMTSDNIFLIGFQKNFGTVVHVAISVQKERLRLWYNEEKVMDMPTAVAAPHNFNQVGFYGAKTREGYPGFYISNFKLAAGIPDMRSKLLEEGKYVTNGILFTVNSDKVKPESYGIIREIAKAIKERPEIKIRIVGHTDSDGSADANLILSKKRAEAVKQILVTEFDIKSEQLTTDGLGASQPVSNNSTAAGKAENRRVEFIKL